MADIEKLDRFDPHWIN